jgi:hypothetical protein
MAAVEDHAGSLEPEVERDDRLLAVLVGEPVATVEDRGVEQDHRDTVQRRGADGAAVHGVVVDGDADLGTRGAGNRPHGLEAQNPVEIRFTGHGIGPTADAPRLVGRVRVGRQSALRPTLKPEDQQGPPLPRLRSCGPRHA